MKMKSFLLCLFIIGFIADAKAQLSEGSVAPDFTAQDTQGQNWNLYSLLDQGKPVLIHFFATWDSFSWDYHQSGELQDLLSLYGPDGSGELMILNIESEAQNTLSQLQGPELISGFVATQTYGDWLTGNVVPVIDDASVATLYQLEYLPAMIIVCPDKVINFSGEFSAEVLYEQAMESSCPALTEGLDPALLNPEIQRVCGSTEIGISCIVKNLGTLPLTDAQIEVAGVAGQSVFTWSGSLDPFQSDTLQLDGIQLLNDNPVQLYLITENANNSNDTVSVQSSVGISTLSIQLELALDNYPDEISWEIRDAQDSVIFEGNDYDVSYEYINENFMLPAAGCYSFYLYDSEGDGLHGSQWGGFDGSCYLRSIDEFGNVTSVLYGNDGSYNFSPVLNTPSFEKIEFEAGSSLNIQSSIYSNPVRIFPNPSDGNFTLEKVCQSATDFLMRIYDASGRLVFLFDSPDQISGLCRIPVDLTGFGEGLYYLNVSTDQDNEILTLSVIR